MSISAPSQIHSIQALRGIAALGVALLHLAGLQMLEGFRSTTGVFTYGWIGVDLFFIISGFIMVWVTKDISSTPKTAMRFLTLRALRVYPLWWVCVSFVALFFFLIHGVPASIDIIPREQAWGYYAKSLMLLPQERAPLLDVGWTLIHELFFYMVFSLIIALGMRRRLFLALAVWGVITAIGIILNFASISPVFTIIFSPLSYLFIAGAVIGNLKGSIALNQLTWPALGAGIAIILTLVLFGYIDKRERVIQLIIPLSILLWSVINLETLGKLKTSKFLRWLGDISYALYLSHPLVILAWRVIRPFYENGLLSTVTAKVPTVILVYIDMAALIAAFLLTATIFHIAVEKTTLRFVKRKLSSYKTA